MRPEIYMYRCELGNFKIWKWAVVWFTS